MSSQAFHPLPSHYFTSRTISSKQTILLLKQHSIQLTTPTSTWTYPLLLPLLHLAVSMSSGPTTLLHDLPTLISSPPSTSSEELFNKLFTHTTMLAYENVDNVVFALYPGEKLVDQIALAGSALEMEVNAACFMSGNGGGLGVWVCEF